MQFISCNCKTQASKNNKIVSPKTIRFEVIKMLMLVLFLDVRYTLCDLLPSLCHTLL